MSELETNYTDTQDETDLQEHMTEEEAKREQARQWDEIQRKIREQRRSKDVPRR
jgi:hypothetical protein